MAELRELLLALERPAQALDAPVRALAALLAGADADVSAARFLSVHGRCEPLLRCWPEAVGRGSRWEQRESVAAFLQALTALLRAQRARDPAAAEALALQVVRERSAGLEKALTWSDKPVVELRALELARALVQVSGAAAREFVRLFNLQSPAFAKMASRRCKKPAAPAAEADGDDHDRDDEEPKKPQQQPFQIRDAFVGLVLDLAACPDKSVRRFAIKEGGLVASLFKSIDGDSAKTLTNIFDALDELVLGNSALDFRAKTAIWSGANVLQLLPLLQSDDDDVASIAEAMLGKLFFTPNAIYSMTNTVDSFRVFLMKPSTATTGSQNSMRFNQSLASKTIKNTIVAIGVNELLQSPAAMNVATKFLTKYPALIADYLSALSIPLEPRPAYRWFCVASLLQKLLSCPIDASSFSGENADGSTSWCSSQLLATRLIAPVNYKKELSRGIQHANDLVVYSTLGIMEAVLHRFEVIAMKLKEVSCCVPSNLESELRFLLPSPESLVSLLMKLCGSTSSSEKTTSLIYVRALSVFRLYVECFPQTISEVKLDFTKLLAWHYLDENNSSPTGRSPPLQSMIVAEMLRFLLVVDSNRLSFLLQRGVANGGSSTSTSKLLQLLLLDVNTSSKAVQQLCDKVVTRVLIISGVFGVSADQSERGTNWFENEEIGFWLQSLHNGGPSCALFVEELVQAVVTDPFGSVAMCLDYMKLKSQGTRMIISPITMALVSFLNAPKTTVTQGWQTAFRCDSVVVMFAVRVLLSLLYNAGPDAQSLSLLIAGGVTKDSEKLPLNDPASDEMDSDATGKKRKRGDQVDSTTNDRSEDAYTWLKQYAVMILGDSTCITKNQIKKARVTNPESASKHCWKKVTTISELRSKLASLSSGAFIADWEVIVRNCGDLTGSFELCHHYLLANAAEDLTPLLVAKTSIDKSKNAEKHPFIQSLPPAILLQHILYRMSCCNGSKASLLSNSTAFVEMVKEHELIGNGFLTSDGVQLMLDQLLFYFSTTLNHFEIDYHMSEIDRSLCELLQILLVFSVIRGTDVRLATRWKFLRLDRLLAQLADGKNVNSLGEQLLAVRIGIFKIVPAMSPDDTTSRKILLRSGFVSALVVRALPANSSQDVLAAVLAYLLKHHKRQSQIRGHSSHAVQTLLAQTITYLSLEISDKEKQRVQCISLPVDDLWNFLTSPMRFESENHRHESAQLLRSGLEMLQKTNSGISESKVVGILDSTIIPAIIEEASWLLEEGAPKQPQILRSLAGVMSTNCEGGTSSWAAPLESRLVAKLKKAKNGRVACAIIRSVYDVFGRIRTEGLQQYVTTWLIPHISDAILAEKEQNPVFEQLQMALLRHWITSEAVSPSKQLDASKTVAPPFMKLTKKHQQGVMLTRAQLFCLLVLTKAWLAGTLENSQPKKTTNTTTEMTVFLVRCCLRLVSNGDANGFNYSEGAKVIVQQFLAQPELIDIPSVLKETMVLFSDVVEKVKSSNDRDVFSCFIELSSILLLIVASARKTPAYDFAGHLAAITEHACFMPSLSDVSSDQANFRLTLVRVISGLVDQSSVYEATLFTKLLGVYNMTLSPFDRSVRALVTKFERQRQDGISLAHVGFRFSASASSYTTSMTRADLVEDSQWLVSGGLEFTRVRATIERFPLNRGLDAASDESLLAWTRSGSFTDEFNLIDSFDLEGDTADVYDPAYLFPMLAHFVAASALAEEPFVQQGLLGLALRATSSSDDKIREYAYGILAHIHESLAAESSASGSDAFKAGRQIHLLLDAFRNALDSPLQRAPSVITVFLNDAISILCRPAHAMYPPVNAFFLSRPALDLHDVPMFYALFNSRVSSTGNSAQQYKQERAWLLHSLRRGVRDDQDVQLMTRRHVLSLLLSYFSTPALADEHTQTLVLQVLHSVARSDAGRILLVTKCASFEWIGAQFSRVVAPLVTAETSASVTSSTASVLVLLLSLLCRLIKDTAWGELGVIWKRTAARQVSNAVAAARYSVATLRGAQLTRTMWTDHGARIESALASISEASVGAFGLSLSLSALEVAVDCLVVAANNVKSDFQKQEQAMPNGLALTFAESLFECNHLAELAHKLEIRGDFDARRLPRWANLLGKTASLVVRATLIAGCVPDASSVVLKDLMKTKLVLKTISDLFAELPALRAARHISVSNHSDSYTADLAALI